MIVFHVRKHARSPTPKKRMNMSQHPSRTSFNTMEPGSWLPLEWHREKEKNTYGTSPDVLFFSASRGFPSLHSWLFPFHLPRGKGFQLMEEGDHHPPDQYRLLICMIPSKASTRTSGKELPRLAEVRVTEATSNQEQV